jgi:hypothetical protein
MHNENVTSLRCEVLLPKLFNHMQNNYLWLLIVVYALPVEYQGFCQEGRLLSSIYALPSLYFFSISLLFPLKHKDTCHSSPFFNYSPHLKIFSLSHSIHSIVSFCCNPRQKLGKLYQRRISGPLRHNKHTVMRSVSCLLLFLSVFTPVTPSVKYFTCSWAFCRKSAKLRHSIKILAKHTT